MPGRYGRPALPILTGCERPPPDPAAARRQRPSTIGAVRVKDSKDRTWRVGRRWLPWRRRIRELPDAPFGLDAPSGDDPISAAIGLVLLVIGAIVLLPVLLVLIGLVLELVVLLALVPIVVAARIAFRRPWTVQVVAPGGKVVHTERVVGWRASTARITDLAERIRSAAWGAA
jgi:hypothetical protein